MHATIEELWEAVFFVGVVPLLYHEDQCDITELSCVEAKSNTYTVALRVVQGNGKGT
jgi:hypothetical protein